MRFGLLSYETHNLGDEIQSIAARRFLPSVDTYIDRDHLSEYRSPDGKPTALICNGWFSHGTENWPPSPDIAPLFISVHFTELTMASTAGLIPKDLWLSDGIADYLKRWEPIGARDMHTLTTLKEAGVDAYFSGCLSLTLTPTDARGWGDYIAAVDLPKPALDYLMERSNMSFVVTSHLRKRHASGEERFQQAQDLLDLYQNARAVVTTRLHCALPCLALQTPVYLIHARKDTYRFSGLNRLVRNGSVEDFLAGEFDFNNPTPNLSGYKVFRSLLEDRINEFVDKIANGIETKPQTDTSILEKARYRTLLEIHYRTVEEYRELKKKPFSNLIKAISAFAVRLLGALMRKEKK